MYLEEDRVDEFTVFEEWLYSQKLSCYKDSNEPSLLLVKVFCFAEKVGISNLQNATLDAIRDRATEQHVSPASPDTIHNTRVLPPNPFAYARVPAFQFQPFGASPSPALNEPLANYGPPATANAVHFAYLNTPTDSPLRKLLADIFAYNVKPGALHEDIMSFPPAFMADVLLINMKRLPLRLKDEEADFDVNAKKYHIEDSLGTRSSRKPRVLEDVTAAVPEPPTEAVIVDEDDLSSTRLFGKSSKRSKKKGIKRNTSVDEERTGEDWGAQ